MTARATTIAVCGAAALAAASLGGCKPDLGAPPSLITGPRVLAIRGTPPEARAGEKAVTFDTLAVDVDGRVAAPNFGWAVCHEAHPPAESNIVSTACLELPDEAQGLTHTVPLPAEACTNFGPVPSKPGARPTDADVTGGYYQPIRATWHAPGGDQVAFVLERILCRLGSIASTDVAGTYESDYLPNNNPVIARLTLDPDGAAATLFESAAASAPPPATVTGSAMVGQALSLEALWSEDTPESFLVYDISSHDLLTQRESLRVSWFSSGGSFEHDRSGRGDQETELFARNVWTAPETPGLVHLWIVLRDSRGGVDFAEATIDVQ